MAAKDKERKEVIELKNDADSNIYSSERSLREHRDSIPADVATSTCCRHPHFVPTPRIVSLGLRSDKRRPTSHPCARHTHTGSPKRLTAYYRGDMQLCRRSVSMARFPASTS